MKIIALLLIILPSITTACGDKNTFEFGAYSSNNVTTGHDFGKSTSVNGSLITIDSIFLKKLYDKPSGALLNKNREELVYMISSGHEFSLKVGIKVFLHLLNYPEYSYDCDTKHEKWNKEELAFAIGRSWELHNMLCKMDKTERTQLIAYYEKYPAYYGQNYDPPWIPENLACE